MNEVPDDISYFYQAIYLSEAAIILTTCLIGTLSSLILYSTQIIHPNLKLLFVWQCFVYVGLLAPGRLAEICKQLTTGDLFGKASWGWAMAEFAGFSLGAMITPSVIVERIWATLRVKSYERVQRPWLAVAQIAGMTPVALYVAYTEAYKSADEYYDVKTTTMWITGVVLSSNVFYLIILAFLLYQNNKKNSNVGVLSMDNQTLTERYQISENIRTIRQLRPVLLFRFIDALCIATFTFDLYYRLQPTTGEEYTQNFLFELISAVNNFCVQTSVILFHPMLRRQAATFLWRAVSRLIPFPSRREWDMKSCDRNIVITGEEAKVLKQQGTQQSHLQALNGDRLIVDSEQQALVHFQTLNRLWSKA